MKSARPRRGAPIIVITPPPTADSRLRSLFGRAQSVSPRAPRSPRSRGTPRVLMPSRKRPPSRSPASSYEGETDASGRRHGRGRLRLGDGVWYEGDFVRGARHGRGTLHFPPEPDPDPLGAGAPSSPRYPAGGDRVEGAFADDAVDGPATYHAADGSTREGTWRAGALGGDVLERDADGFAAFRGAYRDGVRHGEGALAQPDGGLLLAEWVDGELWRDSVGETRPGDASPNAEWSPFAFAYPSRYDDDAFEDVPSLASAPSSARNDEETRSSAFDALRPPFTRAVLYGAWRRNDRAAGAAADGESARCRVAGFYPGRAEATEADAEAFERWLDTRETHPDPTERGGGGGGRAPPRTRPPSKPDEYEAVAAAANVLLEPFERLKTARIDDGANGAAWGGTENNRGEVRAVRDCREGEIVGFVAGAEATIRTTRGGDRPKFRWRPAGRCEAFYLRAARNETTERKTGATRRGDDARGGSDSSERASERASASESSSSESSSESFESSSESSESSGRLPRDGSFLGRGGVFVTDAPVPLAPTSSLSSPRSPPTDVSRSAGSSDGFPLAAMASVGGSASCVVRAAPAARREPFDHPVFGECFALVAARDLKRGAAVTQPPDYAGGWATAPRSEAGYYHHLAETKPAVVVAKRRPERSLSTNRSDATPAEGSEDGALARSEGGVEDSKPLETYYSGSAGVGAVGVTQHGPWRALWLDGVEQGLAYDDGCDEGNHARRRRRRRRGRGRSSHPRRGSAAAGSFRHDPSALGFEYVRAMATVGACAVSAAFSDDGGRRRTEETAREGADGEPTSEGGCGGSRVGARRGPRVLCVGLGAGALPAFFAAVLSRGPAEDAADAARDDAAPTFKRTFINGFRNARGGVPSVLAVEVEPDVVDVARRFLGAAFRRVDSEGEEEEEARGKEEEEARGEEEEEARGEEEGQKNGDAKNITLGTLSSGFRVATADAGAYVPSLPPASFDVAFMDAYDGAGRVPAHLATGAFLAALCRTLAPGGVCACNCWNGDAGGGATLKKSSARAVNDRDAAAEEEEAAAGGGATRKEDDGDTRKEDASAARAYDAFVEAFPRGTVVRVVEVFGQESNVVVVASPPCAAPPPEWMRAGGDAEAAARLGEALARAKRRLLRGEGGEAMRAALCDADRLKVTRPRG